MSQTPAERAVEIAKIAPNLSQEFLEGTGGSVILTFWRGENFMDVMIQPDLSLDIIRGKGHDPESEIFEWNYGVSEESIISKLNWLANTPRIRWV